MHNQKEADVSGQVNGSGLLKRAQAPASGVSVPRHMGVGSDLVHSLDYVVMLQVMFNLASGVQSTPMTVWEQLKGRGIRSAKNARELVGKNAVYESFARLLEAGYLRRVQLPHPTLAGRKGPVVYEVYDNPAWNPDWAPSSTEPKDHGQVKPQIATLPGTPEPVFREPRKIAGQDASRNTGSGNDGSGVPGSVNRRVSAGQNASRVPGSRIVSPPHPPGEEESSSPYPLTDPLGSLPSQREGADFAPEEITAARDFLQQMQRWQAGAATARRVAPKLLATMQEQGWPSLVGMSPQERALLEADLLRNTEGAKSWTKCLPGWVQDLRRYALVRPKTAPAAAGNSPQRASTQAAIAACPACDDYGWLLDDDDSGPQRRCAHPGITRSEVEVAK
ncbi:hypothetical protein [Streptomyces capoamus]|uniref:hypothetical protein n=1 Tax=Streptomyces capoamus TaxID=68183 RepID=UPI0019AF8CC5|nr:hypothetical protein [Streptomyces capoamus]GGP32385.1 hypothetical protein GCM10010501_74840 [Streptomyces libani subsp. rufus]